MKIFLFCFSFCFLSHAQKHWDVTALDGSVVVTNYRGYGLGLDSVVIQHKDDKLRFFADSLCENSEGESCATGRSGVSFITNIEILDDFRYLLVAFENYEEGSNMDIMVYNKLANTIDLWLVADSSNRMLPAISFYYLEDTQELVIPKSVNFIEDDFVFTVDHVKNTFDRLSAEKRGFKTIMLSDFWESDHSEDDLFYRISLKTTIKNENE